MRFKEVVASLGVRVRVVGVKVAVGVSVVIVEDWGGYFDVLMDFSGGGLTAVNSEFHYFLLYYIYNILSYI